MTEYDLGQVVGAKGEDGVGIASISKTGTSGLVDTYTITYTDGDTDTFTVTNGSSATVDIVTSFSGTTSDSKVPSEKLTKTELDKKIATSSTSGLVKNDGSIMASGTGSSNWAVGNHTHSAYVNPTKVTSWSSTPSDSNVASEKLIKDSLDDKVSKSSTTGLLKNDGSVDTSSYLTTGSASSTYQPILTSGTNIKTVNNESLLGSGNITIQGGTSVDIVTSWNSTTSDSKVPSEKLAKTSLDGKLDNAITSTAVTIASSDNILITDYSDSSKVKRVANILASQVKDSSAHSNIGSSANDTQATINTDIDTALGNKISKSSTTGLLKNDGSVDTSAYITSSAITGMLTTSDIANNLTTTTTGKVLDASQGKALSDLIGNAITYINQ